MLNMLKPVPSCRSPQIDGIIIDCDGTIIGTSQVMTPRVREALRNAKEEAHVSFCTGRPYKWVVALAQEFSLDTLHVADGGARVVNAQGEILWEKLIPAETVSGLVALGRTHAFTIGVQIDGEDNMHWDPNPEEIMSVSHLFLYHKERLAVERFLVTVKQQFPLAHGILSQFQFKDDPHHWIADITAEGANKQHALLHLARLEGLDLRNFMGIGDGYNDYPFLLACGFKVAMGNAPQELKDIADYVAPSIDEDGAAEAIEHFVLR